MSYIICRNAAFGFGRERILENISFQVNAGDYLCIVGENGAGKTTLMRTLLGLIEPLSGEILYGDGLQKNQIGYLPQRSENQKDFPASVREVVMSGFGGQSGFLPFYTREQKAKAASLMERLEIAPLAGKSFRNLSGGQAQRVLLARALCAADKLLLMDEPVAGLDPVASAGFYRLIEELNREGMSIIMISHDISEVKQYASHVLHLGKHCFYGTCREYLESRIGREFAEGEAEDA